MGNMRLCLVLGVCMAFFGADPFLVHALDSQQITDLIQSARQGDTRAMRKLGQAYYDGDGVLKDPARAGCWIRQAHESGDKKAEKLWNRLELWKYAGDCDTLLPHREDFARNRRGDRWQDPVTGMVFVWISGGCFHMGCHKNAGRCRENERPVHRVCLDGYWMGAHEVTQDQWQGLMGSNPSRFQNGGAYPVERVSFEQVREFIRVLNHKSPHRFFLPSEAQWEYGCRNRGRHIPYAWGREDFMPPANCGTCDSGPYQGETAPVDSFYANDLGLYHMGGNVGEWCINVYEKNAYQDPGPDRHESRASGRYGLNADGQPRVVRGGAYSDNVSAVGCTRRQGMMPAMKSERVGFRLAVKKRF